MVVAEEVIDVTELVSLVVGEVVVVGVEVAVVDTVVEVVGVWWWPSWLGLPLPWSWGALWPKWWPAQMLGRANTRNPS